MKVFVLCHPASTSLLEIESLQNNDVEFHKISCGTTKIKGILSEASDFFPTYASLNSILFETSVIMTIWEHADNIIGQDDVAFLHTDIRLHLKAAETFQNISTSISSGSSVGLTLPAAYSHIVKEWEVNNDSLLRMNNDPMLKHPFDNSIHTWDYIEKYDSEIYSWAVETNPKMIYSHQFACSRETFDKLGYKLRSVINRLNLGDCGLWTPHMFERLIALYLAYETNPVLSSSFWHYSSSGSFGPGEQTLYGPRPFKFYNIHSRKYKLGGNDD